MQHAVMTCPIIMEKKESKICTTVSAQLQLVNKMGRTNSMKKIVYICKTWRDLRIVNRREWVCCKHGPLSSCSPLAEDEDVELTVCGCAKTDMARLVIMMTLTARQSWMIRIWKLIQKTQLSPCLKCPFIFKDQIKCN